VADPLDTSALRIDAAWRGVVHQFLAYAMAPSEDVERITRSQWRVLALLASEGATRPSDIARRLDMLGPSVSRLLRVLVGRGLVAREQDPDDRRASRIVLTDEGATMLDVARDRRMHAIRAILAERSPAEQDEAAALFERLDSLLRSNR
jgi:DNA-binding MarR family transcriptional regulator